jgi:hypothetical protein
LEADILIRIVQLFLQSLEGLVALASGVVCLGRR